jgi:hypothetical protein
MEANKLTVHFLGVKKIIDFMKINIGVIFWA